MTTVNNRVREEINQLVGEELRMVDAHAMTMAEAHWQEAEQEVAKELGYGDTLERIDSLKAQIDQMQAELAELEGSITERAQPATLADYVRCGITDVDTDHYGEVRPWGKPAVFGRQISTLWDCKVLQRLNDTVSFLKVCRNLSQLRHSVRRELLLTGTFGEVRNVYRGFHAKLTEALGDNMPKLLGEINSIPALKEYREEEETGDDSGN